MTTMPAAPPVSGPVSAPTPAGPAAVAPGGRSLPMPDLSGGDWSNRTGHRPEEATPFQPFGEDGFSFWDLVDFINPLQHLPGINVLYRELTGDTIDPLPRMVGGAIFGGGLGFAGALANVVWETHTGDDIGGHVMTALKSLGDDANSPGAAVADGTPAAADQTAAAGGSASDPGSEPGHDPGTVPVTGDGRIPDAVMMARMSDALDRYAQRTRQQVASHPDAAPGRDLDARL